MTSRPSQWNIVLQEFLQLYKELPCLWDTSCSEYKNRQERENAYKKLVEKYKQIEEDVNRDLVKKRIEVFRNSYRREHKKVLLAKERGETEYKPCLWYYDQLRFLDNVMEWNITDKRNSFKIQNEESELPAEYVKLPMRKRFKTSLSNSSQGNDHQEAVYLLNHSSDCVEDKLASEHNAEIQHYDEESTSFGRTVGLQLKNLAPRQRFIAEKWISDVIFNARINRLTVNTTIVAKDDQDG